jgi:hypothetical protein
MRFGGREGGGCLRTATNVTLDLTGGRVGRPAGTFSIWMYNPQLKLRAIIVRLSEA